MRLFQRYLVTLGWLVGLSRPVFADREVAARAPAVEQVAARGVATQSKFRVFAGADGLKNLVINSIVQDGSGFLWVGTDDGVYRFDGERFTHYAVEEGLSSSYIYVVGVAPDGGPCVGSDTGLVCWDGARFSQASTRGLPSVPVHAMVSFAGKLWVATDGAGLYVRDASGVFGPAPGWPGAPSSKIRALWADAEGLVVGEGASVQRTAGDGVWMATRDFGIGAVAGGGDRITGVLRDREGALWVRTSSRLWILPRGATRATELSDGLPASYDVAAVPTVMALGPRGEVLVGTDHGLAYREHDHWRVLDRAVGLPSVSARVVFVDREATIWVGSAGLAQLRGRGVIEHDSASTGFPGDIAWSYQRDREGTLWVGTDRCLARAVAGRWECLPATEGRVVRTFVFPPQGGVFVGGSPSSLLYIDAAGHARALGEGRPRERTILALALGPEGDLWIATESGLDRLPGAVPGPIEQVVIPELRRDGRFASLTVVGSQLWTADVEGIAVLEHGVWRVFGRADGFLSAGMRYVIGRADGRLCAAYIESVGATCFRYDGHAISALEHIGQTDGLTTGMVYFLGEDQQRRLWIGTGNGVDVMTPHGVDHFDETDGLAGDDSSATAFLLDRDGSLWLGAAGGATHVLASRYVGPPRAPHTAFLDGRLGDRAIRGAAEPLEVAHDHSALTLEFASSSMMDAKHVEYEVRLSPLEAAWSATHQRQARYPALIPGAYRFEVRSRIGAGAWGPAAELSFAVLPAWWQTRWFLALIGLAVLAAVVALSTWRLRRRTRQLHQRSDAGFRAVIDLMPDLIAVHRDGKLIYLNQANCRFLGVPADRWDQLALIERVHPDDRAQAIDLFRRVTELGPQLVTELVELRLRGADGSWRICEMSGILAEIGGALTMVSSGRDVTERKRMRAKLLIADRMTSLGTLAAGIAHEINNPLAYVAGNLEVMAEALDATRSSPVVVACPALSATVVELTATVSDARDGAERVRKIVHGLRSFTRSEAEEHRVALALPDVLEAAIRMTSNEVRHRAELVRALEPTPLVLADDGRLTQVFINLLVNAAHAIPEGHRDDNQITVRTRTDGPGRAVIEIEDTGHGIAPEVQARVFDPFFTTKDVGEGTGLGLSICHSIISGLGGQISIESTPARGCVVRVVLPAQVCVAAPPPAPALEVVAGATGDRRHRVLLVDDEPQVAHTIARLLRRDYDITVALCGREAIDHILGGARFDAIVSDVMMPNMTGIELLEQLEGIAPEQARRIMFLSGGAFTAQTRERLEQLGAVQLEKPVTAKELRAWVGRVASAGSTPALR